MKKTITLLLIMLFVINLSACFYNLDSSKRYSSITEFESDTSLKFYDLYNANYIYTNEKEKLSQDSHIEIQKDKDNDFSYQILSGDIGYTINLNTSSIPEYYQQATIDGYILNYRCFDENKSYEFIVNKDNIQYILTINNKDQDSKEIFIKKVKEYILLNNTI